MNCGFCGSDIRPGYTGCKECGAVFNTRFTGPQAVICLALAVIALAGAYSGIKNLFSGTMIGLEAALLALPVSFVSGWISIKLFRLFGKPRWFRH